MIDKKYFPIQKDVKGEFFIFGREKVYVSDLTPGLGEYQYIYITNDEIYLGVDIPVVDSGFQAIVQEI